MQSIGRQAQGVGYRVFV